MADGQARTAAATLATVTHGRDAGLLHLASEWAHGATIVAGLGCFPAPRVGPRVGLDCGEPGCATTVFGDDDVEAIDRLAAHRRQCHG